MVCTSEFSNLNEGFEHEALDHTNLQGIPERFQTTWVKTVIECGKTFDLVIRKKLSWTGDFHWSPGHFLGGPFWCRVDFGYFLPHFP